MLYAQSLYLHWSIGTEIAQDFGATFLFYFPNLRYKSEIEKSNYFSDLDFGVRKFYYQNLFTIQCHPIYYLSIEIRRPG